MRLSDSYFVLDALHTLCTCGVSEDAKDFASLRLAYGYSIEDTISSHCCTPRIITAPHRIQKQAILHKPVVQIYD
jgi:hypothetical protein